MGSCCSTSRKRRARGDEREPLLPKYVSDVPPQSQFDKVADILAALSTGKYPSQQQIDRSLRLMLNSDFLKAGQANLSSALSIHGRRLIDDLRRIIEALIVLGTEKNGDDKLQDLLWHLGEMEEVPITTNVNVDAPISTLLDTKAVELPTEVISQDEISGDMRKAASSIRSLLLLLFTSNAFRLIISDVLVTARDILADVALDVAKVAAVVEVRAQQMEDAIRPETTELAADKRREGGIGVPSLELLASTSQSLQQTAADATHSTIEEIESNRRNIWQRLEDDDPNRIKETILRRIKEIIEQAQASPKYTAAVVTMASLFQKYIQKLASTVDVVETAVESRVSSSDIHIKVDPQVNIDPNLSTVLEDMKIIVERLSGHGLDLLASRLVHLAQDLGAEDEMGSDGLPAFINASATWLNRALLNPHWIQTDEASEEGDRLYDWLVDILHRKPAYKTDARNVVEEVYAIYDALSNDRAINGLASAIQQLVADLEAMGRLGPRLATIESAKRWESAKAELRKDVVSWVLPRILRALRTIPLPRVELKSDALDLVIDKVTLASPSFVPDHIRVTNHAEVELRASEAVEQGFMKSSSSTRTTVKIDGLRISVEDIAYYLNAKGPLCLGWMDNGLLTIDVGGKRVEGEGLSILLDIEVPSSESQPTTDDIFKVLSAKVDIPGLAFSLDQTRHWIFNTVVTQPLLGPAVRAGLSLVLSSQIKALLESVNESLRSLRNKAANLRGGDVNSVTLEDYWNAVTHKDISDPDTSANHGSSGASTPPSTDVHTRTETEVTTKGIVRTTIVDDAEGEPQSETVLAIGIGEQILPGLGGPDIEDPPTLTEQAREALDELDDVRKAAQGKAAAATEEVDDVRETVRERIATAGDRMRRTRARVVKEPEWRSVVFDL
ncbi:hypothetical protein FRC17_007109 [Serendipita sp. 399]|nr:hypothetical protein FRC17_007109 [Serendipita sp. 399]